MLKRRWVMIVLAILFAFLVLDSTQSQAAPLPDFLRDTLKTHLPEYEALVADEYQSMRQQFGIKTTRERLRQAFTELRFLHDLFTGSSSANGATGGILGIPYFWHWVTPNPRHMIVYLPESKLLSQVPPPKGFERYKSYADVDRVPSVYLKNLVSPKELFSHPLVGSFTTFGWCSEREMAFCGLLTTLGYTCKIKQQGIHTWTEILVPFQMENHTKNIIYLVDNTFDTFEWEELNIPQKLWREDFGKGAQVNWYNTTSQAPQQITKIQGISVGPIAAARIEKRIQSWLAQAKAFQSP